VLPPSGCGPPCFVQLKDETSGNLTTIAVNRPDVWWVTTGSPGRPVAPSALRRGSALGQLAATVAVGDTVRVFGRSLGWTAGMATAAAADAAQLVCASGKAAPTATQTKLTLVALP
jgi:hypothetical protein